MSHFSNRVTASLSPTAYREARQKFMEQKGQPEPVVADTLVPILQQMDWKRLAQEDPALYDSLLLGQRENAGDIIVPGEIYTELIERGFLTL